MRLAAQAKMGYYPTPPMVVSLITGILVRNGPGKIRIFDPFAGEGHALNEIKDSLQCESYGIEVDTHRGKIAKQNLTRCLITDYENSRISNRAFFGVLKKKPEIDARLVQYLTQVGESKAIIHSIENANCDYCLPCSPAIKNFLFRTIRIDPTELEAEIKKYGLNARINQMVSPMSLTEKIKPIMPLRHGHLAQLLACGMMNGVVFDKDGHNPMVVKGITRKVVETRIEKDDGKNRIIETDRIVITINAINQKGELITIT